MRTLFPFVAVSVLSGHNSAQPLRMHELHGTALSHFNLDLRHSAHDKAPRRSPMVALTGLVGERIDVGDWGSDLGFMARRMAT